jgi:hypothetical protein
VLAANPDKWKIARTAAGNAAAKSEMLRRTDLAAGWAGGAKKPDLNSTMPCSNYRPKQSDLTVVGAARTGWNGKGQLVDESANVLRTPRMVKLDWKRTVIAPQVMPCLRRGFKKHAAKNEKLVSLKYVPFPHLTRMTRAYRLVVDVKGAGGTVRVESDLVAIGRGRSELSMAVTGQASSARAVRNTARRLARIVAARLKR